MKKVLLSTVALAAVLSLAGCQQGDKSDGSQGAQPSGSSTTTTQPSTTGAPAQK